MSNKSCCLKQKGCYGEAEDVCISKNGILSDSKTQTPPPINQLKGVLSGSIDVIEAVGKDLSTEDATRFDEMADKVVAAANEGNTALTEQLHKATEFGREIAVKYKV